MLPSGGTEGEGDVERKREKGPGRKGKEKGQRARGERERGGRGGWKQEERRKIATFRIIVNPNPNVVFSKCIIIIITRL